MQDHAIDIAKAVPPVTVSAITLIGYSLQTWVLLLTAIYTCLQIFVLIQDKILNCKAKK